MNLPKIGFIAHQWLPNYGGGEQYLYNLSRRLSGEGFQVSVFTGSLKSSTLDNGEISAARRNAMRYNFRRKLRPKNWFRSRNYYDFDHENFLSGAVRWLQASQIEVALIWLPHAVPRNRKAQIVKDFYTKLRSLNIKTGCIHFDISSEISKRLVATFIQQGNDWKKSADLISNESRKLIAKVGASEAYRQIGSPLLVEPDFIISCSDWSARFIDPLNSAEKITLHPLIDTSRLFENAAEPLPHKDILMINPCNRKNPDLMSAIVKLENGNLSYRFLRGGWGDKAEKDIFFRDVNSSLAGREGRVETIEYLYNIRSAYQASKVLVFPSTEEGYGMTPIEAMYCGLPVVSSNYPAIMEAVGDGCITLCPFTDSVEKWNLAVRKTIDEHELWVAKAKARVKATMERENTQVLALKNILGR